MAGCGCGSGKKQKTIVSDDGTINVSMVNGCNYTISQLSKWKESLDCAYNANLLEAIMIDENTYGEWIGYINFAIDNIDNPECPYAEQLGTILQKVHVLVALNC